MGRSRYGRARRSRAKGINLDEKGRSGNNNEAHDRSNCIFVGIFAYIAWESWFRRMMFSRDECGRRRDIARYVRTSGGTAKQAQRIRRDQDRLTKALLVVVISSHSIRLDKKWAGGNLLGEAQQL
jgi:hypothetical protein